MALELANVEETDAQVASIDREHVFDAAAELSISTNFDDVGLEEHKPFKVPGVERAYRFLEERPGENPTLDLVMLLGPWKMEEGRAKPASALEGKPHAKVYTLVVRVSGEAKRAEALAKSVDYAALKALLDR